VAQQAEHHGSIGRVTLSGEGERAVQCRSQPHGALAVRRSPQQVEKAPGRRHRTHRMRRGWADADLEHVEDAEEHATPHTVGKVIRRA
jgi:hypothetical protein